MESPAVVSLGLHLVPETIRHARLGLSWKVLTVLENWTTRRYRRLSRHVGGDEAVPRPGVRAAARQPVN